MHSPPQNVTGAGAVNAVVLAASPDLNCENSNVDFVGGTYGDTILNPGDSGENAAFRLPEGIDTSSVIDWKPMITMQDGWQQIGSWQMLGTQARHADIAGEWYLISPRINLFDIPKPITLTFEYDLDQTANRGWVDISINGSGWVNLHPEPGQSLPKGSGQKAEVSLSDYAFSIIQLRWGLNTTCVCGNPKACGDCTNHFVVKNVQIKGGIGAEDGMGGGLGGGMGLEELKARAYIADTGNHRVQIFEYKPDGTTLTFKDEMGYYGDGEGEFHLPEDVVVGPDAVVYVADTGNHRIQYFDADGNFQGQFGSYGDAIPNVGDTEGIEFNSPSGVAASAWHLKPPTTDGPEADYFFLYVADTGNHRIQRFKIEKSDGGFGGGIGGGNGEPKYDGEWGYYGDGDGEFNSPEGIDVDPIETPQDLGMGAPIPCQLENWEARVYVADTNNHRVQSFSLEGDFKKEIGSYGDAIPSQGDTTGVQFNSPQDVGVGIRLESMLGFIQGCAARLVDLHVADTGNHRIMYLLRQGATDDHEFQNQFGHYGDEEGLFNSLAGIAADRLHPDDIGLESDIFTADTWNHRYQRSSRQVGGGILP